MCCNIKNEDKTCSNLVHDKITQYHPEAMFHCKKLDDDIINWDGMNFPASNIETLTNWKQTTTTTRRGTATTTTRATTMV